MELFKGNINPIIDLYRETALLVLKPLLQLVKPGSEVAMFQGPTAESQLGLGSLCQCWAFSHSCGKSVKFSYICILKAIADMVEAHHLETTLFLHHIRKNHKVLTQKGCSSLDQVAFFLQFQTPEPRAFLVPSPLLEPRSFPGTRQENAQCYK